MMQRTWRRTPRAAPLALICLLAAIGVSYGARGGDRPGSDAPARIPTPGPRAPAPTLGTVLGAGVRVQSAPSTRAPDLTVTRADAAAGRLYAHAGPFAPDAGYAAADRLAAAGPGMLGPLSGYPTRPALARRRPVAVVLDNYDPDGRPQTGLNRAAIVFEAPIEGGITRLMAVYLEGDAPAVGPVRGTRPPFDAWAAGLHAIYAHAGGSDDALAELPRLSGIADVDPVTVRAAGAAYWRSPDRRPLHDLYTSTAALRAYAARPRTRPAARPPAVPSLPHKVPAPRAARPRSGSIAIAFSTAPYSVQYRYDPSCNCYPRSMQGISHVDAFSGRRIAPANVIVLFVQVAPDPASGLPDSISVAAVGAGRAIYFRDGGATEGAWRKPAVSSPLALLDGRGRPIPLNPGQTWIEAVPLGSPVSWQSHP